MAAMDEPCVQRGAVHHGPPMAYVAPLPAGIDTRRPAERSRRVELGPEQCELDGEHFFIRARICLPVHDGPHPFEWGVWVSLSAASYQRLLARWTEPGRETDRPVFGWLCTVLPGYPSTLHLKTMVHSRPVGERPVVELEPTDHPLAVEQRQGITMQRVLAIAEEVQAAGQPSGGGTAGQSA
jgi:hypothetical protein